MFTFYTNSDETETFAVCDDCGSVYLIQAADWNNLGLPRLLAALPADAEGIDSDLCADLELAPCCGESEGVEK